MARPFVRTALLFALLPQPIPVAGAYRQEQKPDPGAAETTVREALAKLDKGWKPYENKPNLDDLRWKALMAALAQVVRAGPAAAPALQAAAKKGSPWSDATRAFAAKVTQLVQGPAAVRNAIAEYDLASMDTARVGKSAPDFALPDAGGASYRLSQFRGKKAVVLTFIVADT
jgi:hypothetical protein